METNNLRTNKRDDSTRILLVKSERHTCWYFWFRIKNLFQYQAHWAFSPYCFFYHWSLGHYTSAWAQADQEINSDTKQ